MAEHFQIDNAFMFQHARHLPGDAFLVYGYLACRADSRGVCWPSVLGIAAELGRSRNTIRRHLDTLLEYGLVRQIDSPRKAKTPDFQVVPAREVAAGWEGKKCSNLGHYCSRFEHIPASQTAQTLGITAQTLSTSTDVQESKSAQSLNEDCSNFEHKQDPRTRPSTESEYLRFASDIHGAAESEIELGELFPEPDDIPEEPDRCVVLPPPAPAAPRPTAPKPRPAEAAPPAKATRKRNPAPPKPAEPPQAKTPMGAARQAVCAAFLDGYQARHGQRPCFTKADSGILCNALSAVKTAMECDWPAAAEEMGRVLEAFFAADWITERGSSLDLLPKRLNELRNAAKGATNGQSRERDGRHASTGAAPWNRDRRSGGTDSYFTERDDERLLARASMFSPSDPAIVDARRRQAERARARAVA